MTTPAPAPHADRYGTREPSPSRRRRGKAALWTLGVLGTLAAAWTGWSMSSGESFTVKDYGFSVKGPERIDVSIIVSKDADVTLTCKLTALNTGYAEVGTKEVVIGEGEAVQEKFTVEVRTSELATTGIIDTCWDSAANT